MNSVVAYSLRVVAVIVATTGPVGASPPWLVRTWQADTGLPDNTVVAIEQTGDGFLWVATKTGLARFDGVQFTPFPLTSATSPTIPIQALLADRRGRLWVAKDLGAVVCVERGRVTTVIPSGDGQLNRRTVSLVEDTEGAVWVSYITGEVVRIQDGQASLFAVPGGNSVGGACQLEMDGKGQLWFFKGGWVGVFREGAFHPVAEFDGQLIAGARDGGIWLCKAKELTRLTDGAIPTKKGSLSIKETTVTPTILYEDAAGMLWIGTREVGLFRYDGAGFATEHFARQTVLSLKHDRDGNVWVGTRGGGLSQLQPRVVELLTTGSSTSFESVRSVCQDTSGHLWAVGWQKGVVLRNTELGWKPLSVEDGWNASDVQCVAADPGGGIWIGTENDGLFHWREGRVGPHLCTTNGLAGVRVYALLTTATGALWIGAGTPETKRQYLQCREAGLLRTFDLPAESGPVAALTVDAAGDCWAATARGLLLKVGKNGLIDETPRTLAGARTIRCLLATPDGSVWIGYGGQGLGRLQSGRFTHCRMEQGLPDDYISNILLDDRGRLWCAGNRGIFSIREKELTDLAAGRVKRVRPVAYWQKDGLPGLQASYDAWPSALRCGDGRLLFATQSGVAVVYTSALKLNPNPPTVVIERVVSNGKTMAAYGVGESPSIRADRVPAELCQEGVPLDLPPGQKQVEITFTALSLMKPDALSFKYRLWGVDTDWIDAGLRRGATYSWLPPGRYRFQVTACNSDGVWNETGAELALMVAPYWWERGWVRVLGLLLAIGALAGWGVSVIRRRHRFQIERMRIRQATEQERVRIARDLHDDLGARLTEISLLGSLGVRPATTLKKAQGYLGEIVEHSREMVAALDEIVWAVNPKNDALTSVISYFCHYAQRFLEATPIHCRLDVAKELPQAPLDSEQRHGLFLAFKEALNNAVRHSVATELWLRVSVREGTLQMLIEDNGRGLAEGSTAEGADGLINMRDRLSRLGGGCDVRSDAGGGTVVTFTLPLARQKKG